MCLPCRSHNDLFTHRACCVCLGLVKDGSRRIKMQHFIEPRTKCNWFGAREAEQKRSVHKSMSGSDCMNSLKLLGSSCFFDRENK